MPTAETRPAPSADYQQHDSRSDQLRQRDERRNEEPGPDPRVPHPVKRFDRTRMCRKQVPEQPCGCRETEDEHDQERHGEPPCVTAQPSVEGPGRDQSPQRRSIRQAVHSPLPGHLGLGSRLISRRCLDRPGCHAAADTPRNSASKDLHAFRSGGRLADEVYGGSYLRSEAFD